MINDRSNGKNTVRSVIIQDPYIYICVYTVMNFIDPDPDNSFELEQLPLKHIYIYVYIFLIHEINRYFSNIFETGVYTAGTRWLARESLAQTKT